MQMMGMMARAGSLLIMINDVRVEIGVCVCVCVCVRHVEVLRPWGHCI